MKLNPFLLIAPILALAAGCGKDESHASASVSQAASTAHLTCSAPTSAAASGGSGLITVDTPNSDGTRTYPMNATIDVAITTRANPADTLQWSIADVVGKTVASGSFPVPAAATTSTLACTSTLAGYFQVSATLASAGGRVAATGTRPEGFASFGVIPDLTGTIPAVTYARQEQHRFGMQGFTYRGAALAALGISWNIDYREMAVMEPDRRFEFNPAADIVDPFYKQGKVMRLVRLDGFPGWISPHGLNPDYAYLPNDLDYDKNYMGRIGQETELIRQKYYPAMASNYYQITWEPDAWWKDTDEHFVALYRAAYAGLHSTDPHAVVMGPTEPSPLIGISRLKALAPLGYAQYLDGVTTHGYYNQVPSPSHPPEEFQTSTQASDAATSLPNQLRALRAEMQAQYKPNMRLFVTETGISYDSGAVYGPDYPTSNVLFAHGAVVARSHLINLGEGANQTWVFYGPDYPNSPLPVGFGTFFDLDHAQGDYDATNIAPKPAAMEIAAMSRILDGTDTLGPVNKLPSGVYAYGFQQLNGGRVITALWTHDNAMWPESNGEFSSTHTVSYNLKVDADGTSGTVQVIDAMGNVSNAPYVNGAVTLTLSESPQYVVSTNAEVAKNNTTKPVGYVSM
jgi:hypothetical protein